MRTTWMIAALVLGACDPGAAPGAPCTIWDESHSLRLLEPTRDVDLLLVSDDSGSAVEWALMMDQLPRMLRMLSSGDLDGDGTRDRQPVRSIHVGAISTDLGTQGVTVDSCEGDGDDGVLVSAGRMAAGCMPSYPRVHTLDEGDDPDSIVADVACLAGLGHEGCGFEQPLEAALRAISPSTPTEWTAPDYLPPIFAGDRVGHALGANAGFVRPGSVLAIVVIEDEDDCSVADPSLFDLEYTSLGDPNLRCGAFPELLHGIERYARGIAGRSTGLIGLRADPADLVFAAITGVPPELIHGSGAVDYAAVLASAAMELRVDPAAPSRFVPSCQSMASGPAVPPRRIVELAHVLELAGATTTVQSICSETFAPAIDVITRAIADRITGACLPEGDHHESCTLTEVLPSGASCEGLPGLTAFRQVNVDGRVRDECIVRPLSRSEALAGEPGWFVEHAEEPLPGSVTADICGADGSGIRMIGRGPVPGSDARLSCPRSIGPDGGSCHAP